MNFPEPEIRHPTKSATDSLATRFSLPNHDGMQDWEYEVADPEKINDFFEVYKNESTVEDEKFVLLEMLLQSFEDSMVVELSAGVELSAEDRELIVVEYVECATVSMENAMNAVNVKLDGFTQEEKEILSEVNSN